MPQSLQGTTKIPVAVLGATGMVGQVFVSLLQNHPLFTLQMIAASPSSAGKRYQEAVQWRMDCPLTVGEMILQECCFHPDIPVVFSALTGEAAYEVEQHFAHKGAWVFSSTQAHRMGKTIPLVVPEVNLDHLALLSGQSGQGNLITHPNCVVAGLAIALKPLHTMFGIRALHIVTLQSTSGAGYPGVASLDILDNLVPHIPGEEEKIIQEIPKILGNVQEGQILAAPIAVSAQCHRIPVREGHFAALSLTFEKKPSLQDCRNAWKDKKGLLIQNGLPTAPKTLLHISDDPVFPQPKLHAKKDKAMAIHIGQLRSSAAFDLHISVLSHNLFRGGAGGCLLTAESIFTQKASPLTSSHRAPNPTTLAATHPLLTSPTSRQ